MRQIGRTLGCWDSDTSFVECEQLTMTRDEFVDLYEALVEAEQRASKWNFGWNFGNVTRPALGMELLDWADSNVPEEMP